MPVNAHVNLMMPFWSRWTIYSYTVNIPPLTGESSQIYPIFTSLETMDCQRPKDTRGVRPSPRPKSMMHIAYSHAPYFHKTYKFTLLFPQNLRFLLNFRVFASPYFDHDAFMHHALHVLDGIQTFPPGHFPPDISPPDFFPRMKSSI